jgi:hypothetical protein
MSIKAINVRFYCYDTDEFTGELYIIEIDEATFAQLDGVITYERHTVFDNGVRQVCLTSSAYLED